MSILEKFKTVLNKANSEIDLAARNISTNIFGNVSMHQPFVVSYDFKKMAVKIDEHSKHCPLRQNKNESYFIKLLNIYQQVSICLFII